MEPYYVNDLTHQSDLAQPFPQHYHHCHNGDLVAIALVAQCIYNKYRKWKMRRHIKKYLKIVVEFSNLIQDEKNILQDMIKAGFPGDAIIKQQDYVFSLILKQRQAIHDLVNTELQYLGEINNRFFYFIDKPIF